MRPRPILPLLLLLVSASLFLRRSGAAAAMPCLGKGWNLGNRLEWQRLWGAKTAPGKSAENAADYAAGVWTPNRHDSLVFQKVKSQGFDWVRIPVSWNEHAALTPDANGTYAIDSAWMAAVRAHVEYALSAGLAVKLNTHHENKQLNDAQLSSCNTSSPVCLQGWMDMGDEARDANNLPRLASLWTQIALEFNDVATDKLVFEVFNEPHAFTNVSNLNNVMQAGVSAIRATGGNNAERLVFIAGMRFSNPRWIAGEVGTAGNPAGLRVEDFVVPRGAWNGATCRRG